VGSEFELESAGLLDWLAAGNVVAVEWADRVPEALPADRLTLAIRRDLEGGSQRTLDALASGPVAEAWLARWQASEESAAPA
jgi:tRNA A37 threonylcarbamoyladenosine biosynthesis protein TsaE